MANTPAKAVDLTPAMDYGEFAGIGFENTTSSDLSIPFWNILQSNSPAVEEGGLKAGMIINSVTGEVYEKLHVLPCYKERLYVEWTPRGKGGGLKGHHHPESDEVTRALAKGEPYQKLELNGNDLVETFYVYAVNFDPETMTSLGFGVFSFSSTKIKPYKGWYTSMHQIMGKPPIFAFRSVVGTVKQKNEKGSFYNFAITPYGDNWKKALVPPEDTALLHSANNFVKMVQSGGVNADFGSQREEKVAADDDEIPF